MYFSQMVKAAAIFGSATAVACSQNVHAKDLIACHDCHMRRLPKAKELPLYEKKDFDSDFSDKPLPLISEISSLRKTISQYTSYIVIFQERAAQVYNTGVAHSKSTYEYLKNEENKVQRVLIISSGGLIGLVYARKGSLLKKTAYGSLGTGVIFSVFYPDVSKEYLQSGWTNTKQLINNILVKYGGYDTDKMAEEVDAKLELIKSAMKIETIMMKLKLLIKTDDDLSKKD